MTDPQVGEVLGGKYEVEGILGRGGMGVVVAARHRELSQKVAIKCLLPHALAIRDVVERFAREARAAAQIHGEHVARVIDVGRFDDGTPYMVMEHLRGHDLADELHRRGALPVTEAVRYLLETCEAIAQAHALRIVHRDLKPANLYLAETPGRAPIIKVLDFGISKVVEPNADALTKTASVMGTPFYMSPEQLLSAKNVDERTDIWALGVILYELLAGRPPFTGESVAEIVAQILHNAPQPLRVYRPDVPPALEAAIARCMQSKPEARFANVALLAFALAEHADAADRDSAAAIARVLGASPPTAEPAQPAPRPSTPAAAQSSRPASTATAHNLAVSAAGGTTVATGKWPLAVGGVVVAAVLGIGGAIAIRSTAASHDAAAGGPSASALSTATVSPAPLPSPAPLASTVAAAALAPLPTIDPIASTPTATPGRPSSVGPAAPTPARGPHGPRRPAPHEHTAAHPSAARRTGFHARPRPLPQQTPTPHPRSRPGPSAQQQCREPRPACAAVRFRSACSHRPWRSMAQPHANAHPPAPLPPPRPAPPAPAPGRPASTGSAASSSGGSVARLTHSPGRPSPTTSRRA